MALVELETLTIVPDEASASKGKVTLDFKTQISDAEAALNLSYLLRCTVYSYDQANPSVGSIEFNTMTGTSLLTLSGPRLQSAAAYSTLQIGVSVAELQAGTLTRKINISDKNGDPLANSSFATIMGIASELGPFRLRSSAPYRI